MWNWKSKQSEKYQIEYYMDCVKLLKADCSFVSEIDELLIRIENISN
jgi:hypothetical protein